MHPHHHPYTLPLDPEEPVREMELDLTSLIYTIFQSLDMQISLADAKVNLVLVANAALLTTTVLEPGAFRDVFLNHEVTAWERLSFSLMLVTIGAQILSLFYALRTAIPNLRRSVHITNMFYFGHIAELPEKEYVERFLGMTAMDLKVAAATQIHAKGSILQRKFVYLRYSMLLLLVALGCWALGRLALALA